MSFLLLLIIVAIIAYAYRKSKRSTPSKNPQEVVYGAFKTKPKEDISRAKRIYNAIGVDIENVFVELNPIYAASQLSIVGKPEDYYVAEFKTPILGIFSSICIMRDSYGNVDVSFYGKSQNPTKELIAFINFCAEQLGIDENGNGRITEDDFVDSVFSRAWELLEIDRLYEWCIKFKDVRASNIPPLSNSVSDEEFDMLFDRNKTVQELPSKKMIYKINRAKIEKSRSSNDTLVNAQLDRLQQVIEIMDK